MQLKTEYRLSRFEIRINWVIAACVLMTMATFVRLAFWQLDRAAEKLEAQQELEFLQRLKPEAIENIPQGHLHPSNPELQNRHVALEGQYLNDKTVLLEAEFHMGHIGYGVVTPFRLKSTQDIVLVHRGWVSVLTRGGVEPDLLPVDGELRVTAQIYVPEPDARIVNSEIQAGSWPVRMRALEIDVVEQLLMEPVFPFVVRLTDAQPGVLVRHWPAVSTDVNTNLSYALQWFTFALVVLFIALFSSSNLWALMKE